MVVLTHIPKDWIPLFHLREPLLYFLGGSGKIGVSLLFVMTGFFMGWLHFHPVDTVDFWTRRLTRIMPLFLVMVASLSVIRTYPNLSIITQLGIVLGFGFLARLFTRSVGRKLTLTWLVLMLTAALGYIFWLNRIPPAVYYQIWPEAWRTIIIAAANAAMALPFGRLIPQLDGVYWALILEIWFYLLYPVLFVPLMARRQSSGLFITSLFFCFGLSLLAKRILGLDMVNPEFIIYFITGVGLGRNLNWWQKRIKPVPIFWLVILLSAGQYYFTAWLPEFYYPWMRLILAPLAGLTVLSATFDNRWLSHPIFTQLSRYAYALFLTHSLVISWSFKLVGGGPALVFLSLTGTFLLAVTLYHLTEKQFIFTRPLPNRPTPVKSFKPLIVLTLILLFLLDRAFRPPLAWLTMISRHGTQDKTIVFGPEPLRFTFTAAENNLGMITAHLKSTATSSAQLKIRLYNQQEQLIKETGYKAADIYENNYHPFGFPLEPQSRGKTYTLEFQLTQPDLSRPVKLIADEQQFISVYFNPENSWRWLVNKLTAPYTNPLYWFTMLNLVPLLGLLFASRRLDKTG